MRNKREAAEEQNVETIYLNVCVVFMHIFHIMFVYLNPKAILHLENLYLGFVRAFYILKLEMKLICCARNTNPRYQLNKMADTLS